MEYSENALKIYQKLYFNKKLDEKRPNDVHRRVAEFISNNDTEEIEFFEILRTKSFRPNTPTLINAGTTSTNPLDQQLMACFIYKLEDSMDSIIDMWGTLSRIYASGAGAGINITNLREKGSPISSSGQASGPLAYLQVLEIVSQTVMAGGKNRRAANLAVFRHDHPDTLEILDSKRDKKSLRSFNISMLAPDNFMAMICNDDPKKDIECISPNPISKYNNPDFKQYIQSKDLWEKIIENAWETGDPGLLFIDTANKFNPFPSRGKINCANACQEVPLPDWSACVLGAINLNNCLIQTDPNSIGFNWEELERLTKLGVRFLDNVIDKTSYLHPKFEEEMKATRPIGLGIMGLADIFIKLEIPYNSDEAIELFKKICKCLTKTAIKTSIKLAKEKGGIKIPEDDWKHFKNLLLYYGCTKKTIRKFDEYGIRNCTWTTCQPTGTTALSADCSYSFEPLSAIVWQKELAESHEIMTFVNPEFENYVENSIINHLDENTKIKSRKSLYKRIIKNNGSIKGIGDIPKNVQEIFVTAHDINPLDKLNMQAAGQRYISLGISSTCNLPNHATKHDIEKIFVLAWRLGLKGITIYRDQCLDWQPINFGEKKIKIPTIEKDSGIGTLTLNEKEFEELWGKHKEQTKSHNKRPVTRDGKTFEIETPHGRLYLTLNKDSNNKPLEAFLRLGKSGKLENLLLDTLGRVISKNLQSGVPFNEISSLLRGTREDKFWFRLFEDQETPFAAESIIDAIGIIMDSYYTDIKKASDETLKEKVPHELVTNVCYYSECPVCKKFTLSHDSGCRSGQCTNPECFYTSCG